jgi:hypothetical protein
LIFEAIDTIRLTLGDSGITAELGNVGEIISGGESNREGIFISLINIEENRISRDPQTYIRDGAGIRMKNPAIHLNLTLLFTAIRPGESYQSALRNIQQIIEFFQRQYVFDRVNTTRLSGVFGIEKLILEMLSLNLEQLHQLWSMLGGRYQPSVAYRMRMITIDSVTDTTGSLIKEIETLYHLK